MAEAWKVNKLSEKGGKLFERKKSAIGESTAHKVIETVDKGSSCQYPPVMGNMKEEMMEGE